MERTTSLVIFVMFALIAAAIIIAYVSGAKNTIMNGFCKPDPLCTDKTNGQAFCNEDGLVRCTLQKGCLRSTQTQCVCTMTEGVGACQ